jgi:hypothetical protein
LATELTINVDNAADLLDTNLYGPGAVLRWERGDAVGGPFVEQGTVALEAGQDQYEIGDPTGTTSHFYRTRYSNSANNRLSDYSAVFRAGALTAYATVDALREYLDLPGETADNLLSDLLVRASALIDERCGRRFYRSPQVSGDEVRTYDSSSLWRSGTTLVEDIVSLTTLELATLTGGSFTALAGTDWYLYPAIPESGWPYTELRLSPAGSYRQFYTGFRVIRLTGAFGWPAVPSLVELATLDLAREFYWQGRGGRQVGLEFGRFPPTLDEVVRAYGRVPWVYGLPAAV